MATTVVIEPRTLKGFRDFLPAAMFERERVMETARRVYRSFGFAPIDTPALEHLDILLGKGSAETDRQLYRFVDHGGRPVGMRFDLTVPLARFVGQHMAELGTPFKRYHMGKVWRGENTQHGRYREFVQCDFDTIGTTSLVADAEMVLVVCELMRALGLERFSIRLNHRQVLNGMLQQVGLAASSGLVLRALDKLQKAGPQGVADEIRDGTGADGEQIGRLLEFAQLRGSVDEVLSTLAAVERGSDAGAEGVAALREIVGDAKAAGLPESQLILDLSIARGLDYYSGSVIETLLDDLPQIGSICSGGRYDDLASLYTSQKLPGVGASLGLDRLVAALEELQLVPVRSTAAPVLVVFFDPSRRREYFALAARLRAAGIGAELYPEPRKIGIQLKYAAARGFLMALVAGDRELDAGSCQLKNLSTRETIEIGLAGDALERAVASVCGFVPAATGWKPCSI